MRCTPIKSGLHPKHSHERRLSGRRQTLIALMSAWFTGCVYLTALQREQRVSEPRSLSVLSCKVVEAGANVLVVHDILSGI